MTHDGRLYAVLGEERTLVHLASVDGELDRLRANVTRFLLSHDEAYAALDERCTALTEEEIPVGAFEVVG